MDEQFKKLILKSNLPLKKRKSMHLLNDKKESFSSLININNNHNNKQVVVGFQSLAKQYGNSIIRGAQFGSVNDKRRIAKTPKNFMFKKQNLMKRAKTLQTIKKSESRLTNDSFEKSEFFLGQKIDMDLICINISILASYFKSIYLFAFC